MTDAKETEQNILDAQVSVLNQLLTLSQVPNSDKYLLKLVVDLLQKEGVLSKEVFSPLARLANGLIEASEKLAEEDNAKLINFQAKESLYKEFKAECQRNKISMTTVFIYSMMTFVERQREQREALGLVVKPVETPEDKDSE